MRIFVLNEKHELDIDPVAYTLKPFKDLWDRDKSKYKSQAQSELGYIYYMCDYKSDFFEISDKNERSNQIIKNLDFNIDLTDEKLQEAISFYEVRTKTKLISLLEDAYGAIDKLRDYFREVDLLELDDKGKTVHDSSKLLNNIGNLNKVVEGIKSLEMQVKKETQVDNSMRGGRQKGAFEDA